MQNESQAVQELREALRNLAYERSKAEAVIAELDTVKRENAEINKALALKLDALPSGLSAGQSIVLEKQLVTVTSERDKLQYEIDMAANRSRETINHLAAQLAAVTEDRGKWEAVAKANQDDIDRLVKQLDAVTAERDKAQACVAEMRKALLPWECETCNGTKQFKFECPGCLTGEAECTCDKQEFESCPQCQSSESMKELYAVRDRALSTDCGRGFVPVSELDETIAFLKMLTGLVPINTEAGVKALCAPQISRLEKLKGGKHE